MQDQKNKILVTGGCGFIGSHTVIQLIATGYQPVIVDSLENSDILMLKNLEQLTGTTIPFYKTDCCNKTEMHTIFKKEEFSGIIHFAAFKSVSESTAHPLKYYSNNINSLLVVLELCAEFNISDFIFSSSCTVYGNPDHIPVSENNPVIKAASPYGETKIICENIIHDYATAHTWFKPVLLRYFNPVGSHPSGLIGELPIGTPGNLVPYINQTAIGIREQLTVFGNDYDTPDGTCIRDYIHVCDVAHAHVLSLNKIASFNIFPVTFNLGTGKGSSVLEVIHCFEKVTGVKLNYTFGKRRPGDIASIYADVKKAKNELGWECRFTLEDALKHAWQWENNYAKIKAAV